MVKMAPPRRGCRKELPDKWRVIVKIYTLFQTKMAQKPYPLAPHIPIGLYKGVSPGIDLRVPEGFLVLYLCFLIHHEGAS